MFRIEAKVKVTPVLGTAGLLALAAWMLLRFPPEVYPIYPMCPVWRFFHVLCPGCGTTRAMAHLLRGDVRGALRMNVLTTVLLPLLGFVSVERSVFPRRLRTLRDEYVAAGFVAIALVFGVVRNVL